MLDIRGMDNKLFETFICTFVFINNNISENGEQREELQRTTSQHYCCFNIQQILNLNSSQKLKTFNFLENNILSQNKYYYYNYIYNNCATKIRDLFDEIFPKYVEYDSINNDNLSYRELMDLYLYDQKWGDLGIDICLGSEIDKIADNYNSMYLPK